MPVYTYYGNRFPPASSSVRVETGVAQGDEVSVHYDPMIAKLVVHAGDRLAALRLMRNVLGDTHIVGLHTNIEFMRRILAHKDFVDAQVYTGFIPDRIDQLVPKQQAQVCIILIGF
jgi:3-methylcrotonyl-CoA carboxylase alpha subunit